MSFLRLHGREDRLEVGPADDRWRTVVVLGGLGLVPGQPAIILGAEVLLATSIAAVLHVVSLRVTLAQDDRPRAARTLRIPIALAQLLPLFSAGCLLVAGAPWALYLIAAGIVLTLIGSMLDAWVLMVEILR